MGELKKGRHQAQRFLLSHLDNTWVMASSLRAFAQILASLRPPTPLQKVFKIRRRRITRMGKVVEKVKLTSLFEPEKSVEVEAVIDTGATMVVLPNDIVEELGLRKMGEEKVRYANNKVETKPIYGVVNIELKGRSANLDVLVEEKGSQPLIGEVLLELLDLIVEPKTRKLIPNPASPEMPMMEIFMETDYNSGHMATLRSTQIAKATSYVRKTLDEIAVRRET
ncbi:MAG: aspartyl protease family protein [Candidatus Methanospirare jalkutatii]|nr:aspartyl protease family protein [Candidatus Methanospirare jalkutatii]